MAVERVVAGVADRAGEPAAVHARLGVEYGLGRLDPVDVGRRLTPESLRIALPARVNLVIAARPGVHGEFLHTRPVTLRCPPEAGLKGGRPGCCDIILRGSPRSRRWARAARDGGDRRVITQRMRVRGPGARCAPAIRLLALILVLFGAGCGRKGADDAPAAESTSRTRHMVISRVLLIMSANAPSTGCTMA